MRISLSERRRCTIEVSYDGEAAEEEEGEVQDHEVSTVSVVSITVGWMDGVNKFVSLSSSATSLGASYKTSKESAFLTNKTCILVALLYILSSLFPNLLLQSGLAPDLLKFTYQNICGLHI